MMLSSVEHRISFLKKQKYSHIILECLQTTHKWLAEQEPQQSPAWRRSLVLDMAYYVLRHRKWLHTPMCLDYGAAFLAEQYFISHSAAKKYIDFFSDFFLDEELPVQDCSTVYLIELFQQVVGHTDALHAAVDLALPEAVFTAVQEVVDTVLASPDGSVAEKFNNYVQQVWAAYFTEIYQHHQGTPWILDLMALGQRLDACDFQELRQLMHELVWLGESQGARLKAFQKRLEQSTPQLYNSGLKDKLLSSDLCFQTSDRHPQIYLTDSGLQLTAKAAALSFYQQQVDFVCLKQLPHHYVRSVLELCPSEHRPALLQFFQTARHSIPRYLWGDMIKALTVSPEHSHESLFEVLKADLEVASEPLVQKSILRAMQPLQADGKQSLLRQWSSKGQPWEVAQIALSQICL